MNHRTRLTRVDDKEMREVYAAIRALSSDIKFKPLFVYFEQELVVERELYESQTASEFQRGQVVMLKKLLDVLQG